MRCTAGEVIQVTEESVEAYASLPVARHHTSTETAAAAQRPAADG